MRRGPGLEADQLRRWGPDAVPAVPARGGAALVYLITHAKLGAAKVGVADTSGLRLAQHRRAGWQIAAVFSVAAGRAAAVEAAMLERVAAGRDAVVPDAEPDAAGRLD